MKKAFLYGSYIYELDKVVLEIFEGKFEIQYNTYKIYYKSKKANERFNLKSVSRHSIKISPSIPSLEQFSSKEEKIKFVAENWMQFVEFVLNPRNSDNELIKYECKGDETKFDADYSTKEKALNRFNLSDDEKRNVQVYSPYALKEKIITEWWTEDNESFINGESSDN